MGERQEQGVKWATIINWFMTVFCFVVTPFIIYFGDKALGEIVSLHKSDQEMIVKITALEMGGSPQANAALKEVVDLRREVDTLQPPAWFQSKVTDMEAQIRELRKETSENRGLLNQILDNQKRQR